MSIVQLLYNEFMVNNNNKKTIPSKIPALKNRNGMFGARALSAKPAEANTDPKNLIKEKNLSLFS